MPVPANRHHVSCCVAAATKLLQAGHVRRERAVVAVGRGGRHGRGVPQRGGAGGVIVWLSSCGCGPQGRLAPVPREQVQSEQ